MLVRYICFVLTGTALAFQGSTTTEPDLDADVYAIYSLLLNNATTDHSNSNDPGYLISGTASASSLIEPEECVQPPKDQVTEFNEVLADLKARGKTPRTLKRLFHIRKPYELLTAEEVKAFYEQRPDARFKGVFNLFMLSDVYFDKTRTLALTAISYSCGGLCGQRSWVLLKKLPNGEWRPQPWVICLIQM